MTLRAALITLLLASTASADVLVRFDEGAPKDRFTVTNTGGCALDALVVTLDLSTAPAGLVFDITSEGAGVEVFQPFELVAGAANLQDTPVVADGDTSIRLPLFGLAPGAQVAFTIDIDDTGDARPTVVSGSEIAGAEVRLDTAAGISTGFFTSTAEATVSLAACSS